MANTKDVIFTCSSNRFATGAPCSSELFVWTAHVCTGVCRWSQGCEGQQLQYVLEGGEAALRFCCARTPGPKCPVLDTASSMSVARRPTLSSRPCLPTSLHLSLSSHLAPDDNTNAHLPMYLMKPWNGSDGAWVPCR
jgi:hypothetical protein